MGNIAIQGASLSVANSEFYDESAVANLISGSYSAATDLIAKGTEAKAICINFISNDNEDQDLTVTLYSSGSDTTGKVVTLKAGEALQDFKTACYGLSISGTSVSARALIQVFS